MDTIIHADIFFFITSIFVIVLTIGSALAFIYIIPALKDIRELSATAKKEGEKIAEDIEGIRSTVKEKGAKVKSIFDYFLSFFNRRKKTSQKKTVIK